ncbi:MAG: hypothetical protein M1838_002327 [Thelocarpon superellum]|nr:MAG: hypothetical protein M1838_002327 [Thelocarpon superellum]
MAATRTAANANKKPGRAGHVHTHSEKLEDQAATAALYVTLHDRAERAKASAHTSDDYKLSSAGAATSLKHAHPQDLPSFPIVGVADAELSAGTAAYLANKNQKSFEHWKPDPSASASAAAVSAKDYKSPAAWHPEGSAAGSRAALLAAREGGAVDVWPPGKSAWGNSAATQAMDSSRRRADSNPGPRSSYPDAANSAANALNAASRATSGSTHASTASTHTPSTMTIDAARIHNIAKRNISREMYTSHPPVAIEVEEKRKADTLRAAAVSMAKQMYSAQQKSLREAAQLQRSDSRSAATLVHARERSASSATDEESAAPMRFNSIEEAAKKLAAERLAKLHDEHAAYRNYYGASNAATSRLSLRSRARRRASSDGDSGEDQERSRRIRSEMSVFNTKLAEVDTKKRQKDRDALMAAAQRNVRASIHGMDEKVFAATGKVPPSMMAEWQAKARMTAEADSRARLVNHGKVNLGGGKFLDQADIDAVALRNVQPLLDEINEKAEKQRAQEEEARLERNERDRILATEKNREKEVKAEQKRAKELEKQEGRSRKAEEKTKKAEEKRQAKDALRHAKETDDKQLATVALVHAKEKDVVRHAKEIDDTKLATAAVIHDKEKATSPETEEVAAGDAGAVAEKTQDPDEVSATSEPAPPVDTDENVEIPHPTTDPVESTHRAEPGPPLESVGKEEVSEEVSPIEAEEAREKPEQAASNIWAAPAGYTAQITAGKESSTERTTSPSKADSRVRSWFKEKIGRRLSKSNAGADGEKGFVGGKNLTGGDTSSGSLEPRDESMREVALAGRSDPAAAVEPEPRGRTRSPSPLYPSVHGALHPGPDDAAMLEETYKGELTPMEEAESKTMTDAGLKGTDADTRKEAEEGKEERETGGGEDEEDETEEFEEARDQFDAKVATPATALPSFISSTLSPSPSASTSTPRRISRSPVRDSKFSEEF